MRSPGRGMVDRRPPWRYKVSGADAGSLPRKPRRWVREWGEPHLHIHSSTLGHQSQGGKEIASCEQ